ncbi:MAG: 16S rRNA (guanine(527)-N(7))-methyltransferase RsmG [Dehalococcoidia bacterium]
MINDQTKLINGLNLLCLDSDPGLLKLLDQYFSFLSIENQKYNLTSIQNYDDYIDIHILDSLSIFFPINEIGIKFNNVVDIGTGPGFPGIPIKIFKNQIELYLVDSVNKKTQFLRQLISLLNLNNIDVINSRIEALGSQNKHREKYDLIVARAVAKLPTLIEISLPLLKNDGYCIFYKSNIDNDEYRSMLKTLDLFNAKLIDTYKIPFDFINKNRVLIIVQKMNDIDNKYPRSNNKPFRKPLF